MTNDLPPLIVIVGETASGKTKLAIELAEHLNGEIICADSWTVRREVNIGTAKPTPEEQKRIKHHLLDVAGPDEDFTAAVFKDLANKAIEDISSRGKLAIMVGGTGLYVDGVIYDFNFLPAGDRNEREKLNNLGIEELLQIISEREIELGEVDQRNKRRLIRLIETNGAIPTRKDLRSNTLILGIKPDPTHRNIKIEARLDAMMAAGLEQEVQGLVDKYGWDCEALKGVGYAQWRGYFEGTNNLEETRTAIFKANKDLAKRQRTWFKRNKSIHWLNTPVNVPKTVDIVTTFLSH